MTLGEITGTLGVSILLLAFALNLKGVWSHHSMPYLVLNILGALLACISSVMIRFWPFVVLEGVWTVSSAIMLIKQRNTHA